MTHRIDRKDPKTNLKRQVVGHPGDLVKIIGLHDQVAIVQNIKGEKFSINKNELREL